MQSLLARPGQEVPVRAKARQSRRPALPLQQGEQLPPEGGHFFLNHQLFDRLFRPAAQPQGIPFPPGPEKIGPWAQIELAWPRIGFVRAQRGDACHRPSPPADSSFRQRQFLRRSGRALPGIKYHQPILPPDFSPGHIQPGGGILPGGQI